MRNARGRPHGFATTSWQRLYMASEAPNVSESQGFGHLAWAWAGTKRPTTRPAGSSSAPRTCRRCRPPYAPPTPARRTRASHRTVRSNSSRVRRPRRHRPPRLRRPREEPRGHRPGNRERQAVFAQTPGDRAASPSKATRGVASAGRAPRAGLSASATQSQPRALSSLLNSKSECASRVALTSPTDRGTALLPWVEV